MTYRDSTYTSEREERLSEQFPTILTPLEVMDILGVGIRERWR